MQLNKYIAYAGICSRRKAEELIKQGLVTINHYVVKEPAYQVRDKDSVRVEGKLIASSAQNKVYLLLNKPKGYVTTTSDDKGRKVVTDLLGNVIKERVYPVGRLDFNTTGLLVLTNDGLLAQKLAHPKYEVEKGYQVTLSKPLEENDRKQIIKGVKLNDGIAKIDSLSQPLGAHKDQARMIIHSGKHRIVRRIFESLGYFVNELDRIKYAGISKRGLPYGAFRALTAKEVKRLQEL